MEKEYLYYKVTGGKVQEAYDKWLEKYKLQQKAREELCKEFGARYVFANSAYVAGLVYEKDQTPPNGWIKVKDHNDIYKPAGNSKEMKTIRKRLKNDYPLVDASAFQELVLGKNDLFYFMDGMRWYTMVFEHIGEQLILMIPKIKGKEDKWTPPDEFCQLLKNSEYWALKENTPQVV